MMKKILLLGLIIIAVESQGQNRVERQMQFQLNFTGTFLKAFGQSLSNAEVEDFDVNQWAIPGLSIGYHINRFLYLGYAYQPSRGQILKEPWGLSANARDANIVVDYQSGHTHNLDFRFTPFKPGIYLGLSLIHIPAASYDMSMQRISTELLVGQGSYDTDLNANWKFKSVTTLGFGLGYNHVTKSGFSFNVGLLVPAIGSPLFEDINLEFTNPNANLSGTDVDFAEAKLADETFYYPVQFNFSIGYNLASIFSKKE